ncbi:hypothetical protein [Bartonella phoceensis]|nr:hypothetical protein [Bartonella phoceensis]
MREIGGQQEFSPKRSCGLYTKQNNIMLRMDALVLKESLSQCS